MGSRFPLMTAVHIAVLAFHYGADLVTAYCYVPMCPRPHVTYPESIVEAEDCYKKATVISIGCAAGFRKNGASYSVKCDGQSGEWIPVGSCSIELSSFILGTVAFVLVVLSAAFLIFTFRRNRRRTMQVTNVSRRAGQNERTEHVESRRTCRITRVVNIGYDPRGPSNDIHLAEIHPDPPSRIRGLINPNCTNNQQEFSFTSSDMYGPPPNSQVPDVTLRGS
ncbi:uncharacterized protein LOC117304330 isoform X2 [Asterias rubens]|uniref:uncharacterized protein LOC117304330 isoform X2 n=1 Tax=Asterias rubens TaxID=7604 RepID=UPI001455A50A|nr:uncharacterized protein LOC117304330 isoform X2 [Asterias rubens]